MAPEQGAPGAATALGEVLGGLETIRTAVASDRPKWLERRGQTTTLYAMPKKTCELEFGGLILERARVKAEVSRMDMYLAYRELCEELDWIARSEYTVTKWCQGTHDPHATDFLLMASVLNRHLRAKDRLPDFDSLPDLSDIVLPTDR